MRFGMANHWQTVTVLVQSGTRIAQPHTTRHSRAAAVALATKIGHAGSVARMPCAGNTIEDAIRQVSGLALDMPHKPGRDLHKAILGRYWPLSSLAGANSPVVAYIATVVHPRAPLSLLMLALALAAIVLWIPLI